MEYLVVVEKTPTGFSAFVPDLPGCVATAPSRTEIEEQIRSAVEFHVEGLRTDGLPVPFAVSEAITAEVSEDGPTYG
ncbi:MAG: type II toxin-antitoxin system HicB family antitoxin [Spirochaetaceae bacterium]|nr:MAG: type II toxin-antitoxin system HicB family antitoxin [Spirochaetaceae bacterium]